MNKKITMLIAAGLLPVSMLFAQLPVVVAGNVKVKGEETQLRSKGQVNLRATSSTNGIIINEGQMKIKGLSIESNPEKDGMLLNYGTVTLENNSTVNDFKVMKKIKDFKWNYVSLPFDVKISEITDENGTLLKLGHYDDLSANLFIYEFDPVSAAANIGEDGTRGTVMVMPNSATKFLKAGKGYQIAVDDELVQTIVFKPSTEDGFSLASLFDHDKKIQLPRTINTQINKESLWGWNFIGTSQLSAFNISDGTIGGYRGTIHVHKREGGFETFLTRTDEVTIPSFTGYFTQVSQNSELTFDDEGMTTDDTPVNLRSSKPELNDFELVLSGGNNEDKCRFFIGEDYKDGYRQDEDYFKLFSSNTVSQIWSDGNLVINMLPASTTREIPLGIILGKEATHTIAISGNPESFLESITLLDKENNVEHNLLNSGYTFNGNAKEQINDRFSLRISSQTTSIDPAKNTDVSITVFDNILCVKNIVAGDKVIVFDTMGKMAGEITATATEANLPLPAKGVYIVKVSGVNSLVKKIINR